MYSVFSQVLIDHWCTVYKARHRCKDVPTEIIANIKLENVIRNKLYPQIMYCHVISTLDYIAEEASYMVCANYKVRKVAEWVCKNIVQNIVVDKMSTTDVKIRIAISMLNKLEQEKVISKELNLFYFDNIVTNCKDLWIDVNFTPLDKLPF